MTNKSNPQKRGGDLFTFVCSLFIAAIVIVAVWPIIFGP